MESLRNLTYQEQLILQAIVLTTLMSLNDTATIYKVVLSFDKTIAVINELQHSHLSVVESAQEMSKRMKIIIDKIEE